MKCLILASGFGTRLYPLTKERAKPLLHFKGKPVLTHIVDRIPSEVDIFISTNRKFENDFYRWKETINRKVEICVEDVWTQQQKKGAVGSLKFWIENKAINEDLLVIAGDNYFEFVLAQFIAKYDGRKALVAIHDLGDRTKATKFGVVQLDQDRITDFEEKPADPKSSLIATACYILPPSTFPVLFKYCSEGKRDNLGNFIAYLVQSDEVRGYVFNESWLDIGAESVCDLAEHANYRSL